MELWQLLVIAALVLLVGGAAYYVGTHRGAAGILRAGLLAGRQVVGGYLVEHPPTAGALNAIIASGYYALPPGLQARVSLETFERLVLPLLYQAEEALRTPPPAGDRALW